MEQEKYITLITKQPINPKVIVKIIEDSKHGVIDVPIWLRWQGRPASDYIIESLLNDPNINLDSDTLMSIRYYFDDASIVDMVDNKLQIKTKKTPSSKKHITKIPWQEICAHLEQDYKLKEIQGFAKRAKIPLSLNGKSQNKRELCYALSQDYKQFMSGITVKDPTIHKEKQYFIDPTTNDTYEFGFPEDDSTQMMLVSLDQKEATLEPEEQKILQETNKILKQIRENQNDSIIDSDSQSDLINKMYRRYLETTCMFETYCDIIKGYSQDGDNWINYAMRGNPDLEIKLIKKNHLHVFNRLILKLMSYFELSVTDKNIEIALIEIGKLINNIILSSPSLKDSLILYRGEQKHKYSPQIGSVYVNFGMMSTSFDKIVAEKYAKDHGQVYRIIVPTGSHVLPMQTCSNFRGEKEVLLPHNCKFMVVDQVPGEQEITLILLKQPKQTRDLCSMLPNEA